MTTEQVHAVRPNQLQHADGEQDAQFRRSDLPERELERPARMRRERNFDDQQVIRREETQPERDTHVSAEDETAEHRREPDRVEHVIDVVAVTRALVMTHACESAVETVAEPVHRQQWDDKPERSASGPEGCADPQHREDPDRREMVGIHPARQPARDSHQQALLRFGQHALVLTDHFEFNGLCAHAS